MATLQKPMARTDDLVIQEQAGELLVYDTKAARAHCLNPTSAAIWKACDGSRTVTDLSAMFDAEAGAGHGEGVVMLALDQLQEYELLQAPVEFGTAYSRRTVVRALGLTALMIPGISTVAMAFQTGSCGCVNPGSCLTQTACPSTVNCNPSGVCAP